MVSREERQSRVRQITVQFLKKRKEKKEAYGEAGNCEAMKLAGSEQKMMIITGLYVKMMRLGTVLSQFTYVEYLTVQI